MKKTYLIICMALVLTLFMISTSQAIVVYQDLGTGVPPPTLGSYYMVPFDTAPQAAITDWTLVTTIPGSPIPGNLVTYSSLSKLTVPTTWLNWSHGYTGPVFETWDGAAYTSVALYLPPFTGAFYFYTEGNNFGTFNITATSNSGVTSGPIAVTTPNGAKGFGFYTTEYGEYISSISVSIDVGAIDMALGEFGIAQAPFQCVGGICYYNCFAGSCPQSHCDVYILGPPAPSISVGQTTYHFGVFACLSIGCPPTCEVYIPITP